MKAHRYRITVENLDAQDDPPSPASSQSIPLVFEAGCHDDLFAIVERMRTRQWFEGDEGVAFAVGLKLFGEVMLKHREDPLFAPLQPHFGEFMKGLKRG